MKNNFQKESLVQDVKLSTINKGGEEIPAGGWRAGGGEEIPPGGWRTGGGEEIPPGGWRAGGGEEIPPGGWRTGGGEEIPPGGWRAVEDIYRTMDGTGLFKFRFYPTERNYEIDILSMPEYGNRSMSLKDTQRIPSDRGVQKIYFNDESIIKDLKTARSLAARWAERTMLYIKDGVAFTGMNQFN